MDKTFFTLLGIEEKWRRAGNRIPSLMMAIEVNEYGLKEGLLTHTKKELDTLGDKESDESILWRACMGAALFQMVLGEDVGSVPEMTREQQLEVIHRADPISDEIKPMFQKLGFMQKEEPKKVLH